jgi:hypothetical protein
LPPSAQLTARGGGNTHIYRAADTNKHQLWSRLSNGDSLDLELLMKRIVAELDGSLIVFMLRHWENFRGWMAPACVFYGSKRSPSLRLSSTVSAAV